VQLNQVECFLAVVDHQGINAAARALGLAQPTISHTLRGLERELGVALFHRIGRGMVLSSAGHALVGPARRILRGVVAAEGALVDVTGRQRGRLDLAAMAALSVDPLAPLVGAFRRELPGVSVRVGELRDDGAAASVIREGHCEIGLCHLPVPDLDGLTVLELGVQELWLVFPPGSTPPERDPLPLSELHDEPYVIVPRGSTRADEIEEAFAAAGRAIRPAAVLQQREARLPFVLAGVGATVLERSVAEAAVARGAVVRATEPPISWPYGLVYDPAALSPAGRAFIRLAERRTRAA
jgi:DNA-binding transcriptional LysR family regulator